MRINLNKCKKGDVLISKHGVAFFYNHKDKSGPYPHVIYHSITNAECTRTTSGHVFKKVREPEDHDIVKIIPLTENHE